MLIVNLDCYGACHRHSEWKDQQKNIKPVTTATKTSKFRTSFSVNSVKRRGVFFSNNFKRNKNTELHIQSFSDIRNQSKEPAYFQFICFTSIYESFSTMTHTCHTIQTYICSLCICENNEIKHYLRGCHCFLLNQAFLIDAFILIREQHASRSSWSPPFNTMHILARAASQKPSCERKTPSSTPSPM